MARWDKSKREIFLYDVIGSAADGWFGGETMADALKALGPGDVHLRINSPGGGLFETWSMIEQLRRHPGRITTSVEGLAASAASALLLAGEFREMSPESMIMVHHPWAIVAGDHRDLRKLADDLEKSSDALVAFYSERTGIEERRIRAMLDAETYLNAQESLAAKFVHRITGDAKQSTKTAASARPHYEAAVRKLAEYRAKREHDDAKREATARAEKRINAATARRIIGGAISSRHNPAPHRTAARLAILKRMLKDRRRQSAERDRRHDSAMGR